MSVLKRNNWFYYVTILVLIFSLFSPLTGYAAEDITPPKLNSIDVSKNQATTGDTIEVFADITEEGSGLYFGYVRYIAPAGTGVKYANIYYNRETSKYEGSFQIDKNDVPGTWVVDTIWLEDKQNNYYYYVNSRDGIQGDHFEQRDFSPYSIEITGTEADITAPSLTNLHISSNQATPGDIVNVTADITEEGSGFYFGYIRYKSPMGTGVKYANFYYNSETSKYEGSFQVDSDDVSGTWVVDTIWLEDRKNNYYYYVNSKDGVQGDHFEQRDFSAYNIEISGTESDVISPSLESLNISKTDVTAGDTVKVTADIKEEGSGFYFGYIRYVAPAGTGVKYANFYYNGDSGKFEGSFDIGEYDALGTWVVDTIWLEDRKNNYYYYVNSKDDIKGEYFETRDLSSYNITVKEYDQIAPKTSIEIQSANAKNGDWYTATPVVSFAATDEGTGVNKTYYRVNNSAWVQYERPFEILEEGVNTIEYKSLDKAGNEEEVKIQTVQVDTSKPLTTINKTPENWTNKEVRIELVGKDDVSGIALTEYQVDKGDWQPYQEGLTIREEGIHTIQYRSVDNAGNVGDIQSKVIKIDTSAPETLISPINGGWNATDVKLHLTSQDALSEVVQTQYRINNGNWVDYDQEIIITSEGVNNVEYRSVDSAGNVEEVKGVEVRIDKSNPTLKVSFDQSTITENNHKLIPIKAFVSAEDSISGVASFELVSIESNQLDNGNGDGNTTQDIQGTEFGTADVNFSLRAERSASAERFYKVTYKATDNAGNSVLVSEYITVEQKNKNK